MPGLVAALVGCAATVQAGAGPPPQRYYVAIGASETLGYQGTAHGHSGRVRAHGYTDDVAAAEQARWPGLELKTFACAGLRMDVSLDGGRAKTLPAALKKTTPGTVSGRCVVNAGSEVGHAARFLRAHRGQVALVTIDVGYADLATCFRHATVNSTCVTATLGRVSAGLPTAVRRLRSAGGSSLRIVGIGHGDPTLAAYLKDTPSQRAFATATATATEQFTQVTKAAYASVHVPLADISQAFSLGVTSPVHSKRWGSIPLDVGRVCTLTWVCVNGDIHPNTQGYHVIASSVEAAARGH